MSLRLLCEPTPEMKRLANDFDANIAVMLAALHSDLKIEVSMQREDGRVRVIALFIDRSGICVDGLRADFDISPAVARDAARAVAMRFADFTSR